MLGPSAWCEDVSWTRKYNMYSYIFTRSASRIAWVLVYICGCLCITDGKERWACRLIIIIVWTAIQRRSNRRTTALCSVCLFHAEFVPRAESIVDLYQTTYYELFLLLNLWSISIANLRPLVGLCTRESVEPTGGHWYRKRLFYDSLFMCSYSTMYAIWLLQRFTLTQIDMRSSRFHPLGTHPFDI